MKLGIICQSCGVEAPSKYVEFHQNIGALVVRYSKCIKGNLCKRCLHKHFWSTTSTTAAIGWLGTISLILAPCFVLNNIIRYLSSLTMPRVPAGAMPPVVTDDVARRITPHLDAIFARLNAGEKLTDVCRAEAPRLGVTPGQILKFVLLVVEQQRQLAQNNRPTGGFPVMPPKPVAAIPVEPVEP